MREKTITAALMLFGVGALGAQTPSYLVTRLGVDTVAIERYTRTRLQVEGDLAVRFPRVRNFHYVARLGPRGEITSITTTVRRPTDTASAPLLELVGNFRDTVAVYEARRAGRADSSMSGRRFYHTRVAPTLQTEPPAYGIYEQVLSTSRIGRDSAVYALVSTGRDVPSIILKRGGRDTVTFRSTFFPNWTEVARVDSRGRLLSVDATATTDKTIAQRVRSLDFERTVARWAAEETARGGRPTQLSVADTVRANVGGANIKVGYSRPSKRGRVIFGNIVPWNQVWRTGANAATQFETDRDLIIGGATVPAGKYTLFTLPTPNGAKLIISTETGQWGTDYHADKDLTRVDLQTKILTQPVEQFVIGVDPQASGGLLRMAWDDREYSIPFTVK